MPANRSGRKKLNTLLFMAAATLCCALITIILFAVMFFILIRILDISMDSWLPRLLPVVFVSAVVFNFLIYRFLLDTLFKRTEIDEYFDPIAIRPRFLKPAPKENDAGPAG